LPTIESKPKAAVEQLAGAAREQLVHRALRGQRQGAKGVADGERGAHVAPAMQVRRWRAGEQRAQQVDGLADVRVERGEPRAVVAAAGRERLRGVARAGTDREASAVRFEHHVLQRSLEDREAVLGEAQVLLDAGMQQAHGVAGGRVAEAGVEFLGDRGASGDAPAFVQGDPKAGRREVRGAGQAVVARPDDGDVRIRPTCGRGGSGYNHSYCTNGQFRSWS
jgi:hypothetical protein